MAPQRGTPPPRRCTMTMELLRVPQSRKTPAPRVQGTVRQVAGRGEIRQFPTSAVRDTVAARSEEHTSELQSLMRISYAVFCLKKKNTHTHIINTITLGSNTTYTSH